MEGSMVFARAERSGWSVTTTAATTADPWGSSSEDMLAALTGFLSAVQLENSLDSVRAGQWGLLKVCLKVESREALSAEMSAAWTVFQMAEYSVAKLEELSERKKAAK